MTGADTHPGAPPAGRTPLWVVSELYYPEQTSTGYFLTEIAEGLADEFDVRAVCGQPTYSSAGIIAPARETRGGVDIFRMRSTRLSKDRLLLRLLNVLTLSLSTFFFMLYRVKRGDLVLVVTNPPALPPLLALVCKLRGARAVLLVHDVYPDVFVAVGLLKPRSLPVRCMDAIMRLTFAAYAHVIVLGADMERLVARRRAIAASRVTIIPNWGDTDRITPIDPENSALVQRLGIGARTIVQYSGNIGRTHNVELVFDVARRLNHRKDIVFLFAGEGNKMPLAEMAAAQNDNIIILPRQPADALSDMLACATCFLIAMPAAMTGISVPSRMYNIMAAGRPIVSVGDRTSTLSELVCGHDAGWWCADDAATLQSMIETIASDAGRVEARAKGRNARALAERNFRKDLVIAQYAAVMRGLP